MKFMLTLVAAIAAAAISVASVSAQPSGPSHDQNSRYDQPRDLTPKDQAYGAGQAGQNWSRGERLPTQYRQKQYVVSDWKGSHLRKPPRGYHWVRNENNDYFLAGVATGLIADVVRNNNR